MQSSKTHSSVLKTEAALNAATLKAKLQYHQEETEQKAKLERLTMLKNLAIEEAKIAALNDVSNNVTNVQVPQIMHADVTNVQLPQTMHADVTSVQVPQAMHADVTNVWVPQTMHADVTNVLVPQTMNANTGNNMLIDFSLPLPNSSNANHCSPISDNFPSFAGVDIDLGHNHKGSSHVFDSVCVSQPKQQTVELQSKGVDPHKQNETVTIHSPLATQNNVPVCVSSTLNHNAPVFLPSANNGTVCDQRNKSSVSEPFEDRHGLGDLFKSISELVNINRLPVPEPGVFDGDPLQFLAWKSAFCTLIEKRGIAPSERVHYLKRYLSGDALKCVSSLLLIPTDDSYVEAMALIEKRFGDPYNIACAFKSKIENWPKIHSRDSRSLRDFSDFLKQCEVAARHNPSLRVLNDDTQNRVMLSKLPDWLVSRWAREVHKIRQSTQQYPLFANFVSFLSREADIACEPVTMLHTEKKDHNTSGGKKTSQGTSHLTLNTVNANQNSACHFCQKTNHPLEKCFKFKSKPMQERKAFIIEKKLCFGCLSPGHSSKFCKQRLYCSECKKRHPTPLHGDVKDNPSADKAVGKSDCEQTRKTDAPKQKQPSVKDKVSLFIDASMSKSTMIVPVYVSHSSNPESEKLTYALLDTQSDTSFVTDEVLTDLGVQGTETSIVLSTMTSDNTLISCQRVTGLSVRAYNNSNKLALPALYSRDHIPAGTDCIPSFDIADRWPYLRSVVSQLMPKSNCGIGLLIGYNCPQALVPREVVPPVDNGPFAQKTDLGWGIIGLLDVRDCNSASFVCSAVSGSRIVLRTSAKEILSPQQIAQFFNREETQETGQPTSQDDIKFLSLMQEQAHQTDDRHYQMPLPLRNPKSPPSPNNRQLALQRLHSLTRRFSKDPQHHQLYCEFMSNLLKKGYAERVPAEELGPEVPAYYLAHHGVYNPSKPGKIRVVMDGSAKYFGKSLNDHLLTGPDLMNNLVGVLCRFRMDLIAFMCDIEGMFQQFKVNPEHRNFLRFFWFQDGDYSTEPVEYRSTVHLFGAASSPAIANFGLKKAASDYEWKYGSDVKDFVHNNFYVDDGLKSVSSVEESVSLVEKCIAFCEECGLKLHKFVSNSPGLLDAIPVELRASQLKDHDVFCDMVPLERALGVKWCIESDTFRFRIIVQHNSMTRRGVLSTVCSVYDPLGLIAPVVLQGKKILQSLCKERLDWDDPLPESIQVHWERWLRELPVLERLEVSRCFKPENFKTIVKCELHSFSDASLEGYGQCTYLRLKDIEDNVHCTLVMAKSRVAPLKSITIPRLELSAAVLSTDVSCQMNNELPFSELGHVFWTDSKIVLGFIANSSKRFHIYVANRVQKIRDFSNPEQWNYVNTATNPADLVSRGCTGQDLLQSNWFRGPDFLWENEIEYLKDNVSNVELPSSEIKHNVHLANVVDNPLEYYSRFSSWTRIIRIISTCFAFCRNLKSKTRSEVKVEDQVKAKCWLISQVQRSTFGDEIELLTANEAVKGNSKLVKLDPFMDENGLIRVGGRIQQSSEPFEIKHPIVLPKDHFLTHLLVRHLHERTQHQGKGMTINEVRNNGFWVLGLSSLVSSLIHACVMCRRHRRSPSGQKMSDLPEERVEPSSPFTHVAVDYFGPCYIKDGRKELKRYGVLFTCLSTRAVHIETANTLDSDSYINALRRFLCVRGPMRTLRSDRGTNITSGMAQLQQNID